MKEQFYGIAARLEKALAPGETLLCNLSAERSDFVRFNKALVRQAGSVEQAYLSLRLVSERRQAQATGTLAGNSPDPEVRKTAIPRPRAAPARLAPQPPP